VQYKNIFDINFNWKSITLLALLAFLPDLTGMINLPTVWGFKIHFFQYFVFVAAAVYGPVGGLISGGFGSVFTVVTMNNPHILIGNMILGFFTGWFFRKGINLVLAALIAYAIQMPWLWLTDVYLANMPINVVNGVVIALFFSDVIWALFAHYSYKKVRNVVE